MEHRYREVLRDKKKYSVHRNFKLPEFETPRGSLVLISDCNNKIIIILFSIKTISSTYTLFRIRRIPGG